MPHWEVYARAAAKFIPGRVRRKLLSPAFCDAEAEGRINA
jgi:hypothetical protein